MKPIPYKCLEHDFEEDTVDVLLLHIHEFLQANPALVVGHINITHECRIGLQELVVEHINITHEISSDHTQSTYVAEVYTDDTDGEELYG
jgi:hypothetical protein